MGSSKGGVGRGGEGRGGEGRGGEKGGEGRGVGRDIDLRRGDRRCSSPDATCTRHTLSMVCVRSRVELSQVAAIFCSLDMGTEIALQLKVTVQSIQWLSPALTHQGHGIQ